MVTVDEAVEVVNFIKLHPRCGLGPFNRASLNNIMNYRGIVVQDVDCNSARAIRGQMGS